MWFATGWVGKERLHSDVRALITTNTDRFLIRIAFKATFGIVNMRCRQSPCRDRYFAHFTETFNVRARDGDPRIFGAKTHRQNIDHGTGYVESQLGRYTKTRDFHIIQWDGHHFRRGPSNIDFKIDRTDLGSRRAFRITRFTYRTNTHELGHATRRYSGLAADKTRGKFDNSSTPIIIRRTIRAFVSEIKRHSQISMSTSLTRRRSHMKTTRHNFKRVRTRPRHNTTRKQQTPHHYHQEHEPNERTQL